MNEFYGPALSAIHDQYYGDLAYAAGSYLAGLRGRGWLSGKQAVDLGCGSGILAGLLAAQGAIVTGIDVAGDMLEIARKQVPDGRFIQASIHEIDLPGADLFCATGEPFNYFSGERPPETDLKALLARIHDRLSPGGILLFDLLTDTMPPGHRQRKISFPNQVMQIRIHVDGGLRQLTREIQVTGQDGKTLLHEVHYQTLFASGEIERALAGTGFKWDRLSGYGTHTFRTGHVGYCCTRS